MRRARRVEKTITKLAAMDLIYLLGGGRATGHISWPATPGRAWTDCSGFACLLCQVAGIRLNFPAGWTGTLVEEGEEGTSPYFTLFIKEPLQTEGHVIIRLRKRPRWWHFGQPKYRWAECGGRDNPRSGGGPTWFRPTAARIEEFPFRRHFPAVL